MGLALCILLFIASRPYLGVRHDGILYAAQALRHLHPQVFADDLFFRFGSQDSFSLFGRVYAVAVGAWGLEAANRFLVLLSQALFLGCAGLLAHAIVPAGLRLAGLTLLALSSGAYGGLSIFRIAEPFVTARPFAEALLMLSLALLVRGQRTGALAFLLMSALLHPLIALPGLLIWWLAAVREDRRFLAGLVAVPMALGLAWRGVAPFSQLLQFHDLPWRELLAEQNKHVFLLGWRVFDWALLATDLGLAWLIRRELPDRARTLFDVAIAACLAGLAATAWGADVLSNVLLTSLQPWRAQWPLMVLVALLLPLPLVRWASTGPAGWLVAGLMVYAFVNRGLTTGWLGLILALALVHVLRRRALVVRWPLVFAALAALLAATAIVWLNVVSWVAAVDQVTSGPPESLWGQVQAFLRRPPLGPLMLCLPVVALAWWGRRFPVALAAIAAATVALAGALWDQRSGWARMVERQADGQHPFVTWVQPTDEVFWVDDPVVPWLLMHRRSYLSGSQLAGQMFNRETAEEGTRRLQVLELFEYQQQICELMNGLNNKVDACQPDVMTLRSACEADPKLRYMVTGSAIDGLWLARWVPPSPKSPRVPAYYLYPCDKLIEGGRGARQG